MSLLSKVQQKVSERVNNVSMDSLLCLERLVIFSLCPPWTGGGRILVAMMEITSHI